MPAATAGAKPPVADAAAPRARPATAGSTGAAARRPEPTPEDRAAAQLFLREAARTPAKAAEILLAACLDRRAAARAPQLVAVAKAFGAEAAQSVGLAIRQLENCPPLGRLPALVTLVSSAGLLPVAERGRLLRAVIILSSRNPQPSVLQVCLARLVHARFVPTPATRSKAYSSLTNLMSEVQDVFATLARFGHADAAQAARAYAVGIAALYPSNRNLPFALADDWPKRLDRALAALQGLHPSARRLLRDALTKTVTFDGRLAVAEAEVLRAVCLLVNVPMPALGEATSIRDAATSSTAAA